MRIVTYIILGILILVFFTSLNNFNTDKDVLDYPLRSLQHANVQHLLANGVSLFALSFMEEIIGWGQFLMAILFIWIVSSIILLIIHTIFPSRKVHTVGFSGVIFGLFVVYFSLLGKGPGVTLAGLVISILPQLLTPGISFEGHLAGIFAGIIYVMLFPVKKKIVAQ